MWYAPNYINVYININIFQCTLILGPVVCSFTHMYKLHFYFSCHAWIEWKDKAQWTQNTNETENVSTHAMSEMISFIIFPFQFAATLLDFRLLTGHFIFPDFEREQGYRPHLEQMPTVDIPFDREGHSPPTLCHLAAHLFQEHTQDNFHTPVLWAWLLTPRPVALTCLFIRQLPELKMNSNL